jgi:hypothetical protein
MSCRFNRNLDEITEAIIEIDPRLRLLDIGSGGSISTAVEIGASLGGMTLVLAQRLVAEISSIKRSFRDLRIMAKSYADLGR